MSTNRFLGLTCGLLALISLVAVGSCALGGAILTTAVAAGIGQTFEAAADALPIWVSEADDLAHSTISPAVPAFAEALVERIVTSSDLYAQTLSEVRASSDAREVLGWPIEAEGGLQVRKFENSPWGAKADMAIGIRGPQAAGVLTVTAHRFPTLIEFDSTGIVVTEAREWTYDQLLLSFPDRQEHIDLLNTGR